MYTFHASEQTLYRHSFLFLPRKHRLFQHQKYNINIGYPNLERLSRKEQSIHDVVVMIAEE